MIIRKKTWANHSSQSLTLTDREKDLPIDPSALLRRRSNFFSAAFALSPRPAVRSASAAVVPSEN